MRPGDPRRGSRRVSTTHLDSQSNFLAIAYRDNDVRPLVRRFAESSPAVAHASTPDHRSELIDEDDGFSLTLRE